MITTLDLKAYLEKPYECPFCHSENISGGELDADNTHAWRDVHCNDCGKDWTEEFTITKVEYKEGE